MSGDSQNHFILKLSLNTDWFHDSSQPRDELVKWELLVKTLQDLGKFEKVTFFRLEPDLTGTHKPKPLKIVPDYDAFDLPSLYLKSRETRVLSAYVIHSKDTPYRIPELKLGDKSKVHISGPFIGQKRLGEQVTYIIQIEPVLREEIDTLLFQIPLSENALDDNKPSPEFRAILRCKPSKKHVGITIGLLVIGFFLLSIGPDTLLALAADENSPLQEHHRWLGVLSKVSGSFLVAGGYLYGFRRLPYPT